MSGTGWLANPPCCRSWQVHMRRSGFRWIWRELAAGTVLWVMPGGLEVDPVLLPPPAEPFWCSACACRTSEITCWTCCGPVPASRGSRHSQRQAPSSSQRSGCCGTSSPTWTASESWPPTRGCNVLWTRGSEGSWHQTTCPSLLNAQEHAVGSSAACTVGRAPLVAYCTGAVLDLETMVRTAVGGVSHRHLLLVWVFI